MLKKYSFILSLFIQIELVLMGLLIRKREYSTSWTAAAPKITFPEMQGRQLQRETVDTVARAQVVVNPTQQQGVLGLFFIGCQLFPSMLIYCLPQESCCYGDQCFTLSDLPTCRHLVYPRSHRVKRRV